MIKLKIVNLIIIFVLLSSLVFANGVNHFAIDDSEVVGTDLPGFARSLFGNQRMNIHISLNDGSTEMHGLVTENGVVTQFTDSELSNPTVNVYTSEDVIVTILNSENSISAFQDALNNGGITYNAIGFVNRIRFSFVSVFVRLANFFSGNEGEDSSNNGDSGSELTGSIIADTKNGNDGNNANNDNNELKVKVKEEIIGNDIEDTIKDDVHVIKLTSEGFSPEKLTIKSGDKVIWENERNGNFNKAMVIGVRSCRNVKSKVFNPGESYEYIFNEKGTCTIVDGMMTTVESKIYVR